MRVFTEAVVKFNNGKGALLCNKCATIIAHGFDHEDVPHLCENCGMNLTSPIHGGKITCWKCSGFFRKGLDVPMERNGAQFHEGCYNRYEHYYGLDKPID